MMDVPVNTLLIKSLQRYPAMFGALSGLFLNLLDECLLPDERKQYYIAQRKNIDNRTRSAHNGTQDNANGTT